MANTPTNGEQWRLVFYILVKHFFADPAAMGAWLTDIRRDRMYRRLQVQGRTEEVVAGLSIGVLERTTGLRGSLSRQLGKALADFRVVKKATRQQEAIEEQEDA